MAGSVRPEAEVGAEPEPEPEPEPEEAPRSRRGGKVHPTPQPARPARLPPLSQFEKFRVDCLTGALATWLPDEIGLERKRCESLLDRLENEQGIGVGANLVKADVRELEKITEEELNPEKVFGRPHVQALVSPIKQAKFVPAEKFMRLRFILRGESPSHEGYRAGRAEIVASHGDDLMQWITSWCGPNQIGNYDHLLDALHQQLGISQLTDLLDPNLSRKSDIVDMVAYCSESKWKLGALKSSQDDRLQNAIQVMQKVVENDGKEAMQDTDVVTESQLQRYLAPGTDKKRERRTAAELNNLPQEYLEWKVKKEPAKEFIAKLEDLRGRGAGRGTGPGEDALLLKPHPDKKCKVWRERSRPHHPTGHDGLRFSLSFSIHKNLLMPRTAQEVRKKFEDYDRDHSGRLDSCELQTLAADLGRTLDEQELEQLVFEAGGDDGKVDCDEFVEWWANDKLSSGLCMMSNSCESAWVSIDDDGLATVNLFASVSKSHHLDDMQDGQRAEAQRRRKVLGLVVSANFRERLFGCLKSKWFLTLACLVVIIGWVVIGAAAFTYFETDRQNEQLHTYKTTVQRFQSKYNISSDDLFTFLSDVGAPELDQYHTIDAAEPTELYGYYFPNLYTASSTFAIITTVGYGKVAPETAGGKLFLIASIIFGIPCIGLLLAELSKNIFRLFERFNLCFSLGADEAALTFKDIDTNNSHTLEAREMRKAAKQLVYKADNWVDDDWMEQIVRNDGRSYGDGIYWEGGCTLRAETAAFTLNDFKHIAKELHLPFKQQNKDQNRAIFAGLMLILWINVGTVFYCFAESMSWLDALYFSIVTLSTVGLGDITPQTVAGVIFTFVFDIIGLELMAINLATIGTYMRELWLQKTKVARASAKQMMKDPNKKRQNLEFIIVQLEDKVSNLNARVRERDVSAWGDVEYNRWQKRCSEDFEKLDESIKQGIEDAMAESEDLPEEIRQKKRERIETCIGKPLQDRVQKMREYVGKTQASHAGTKNPTKGAGRAGRYAP